MHCIPQHGIKGVKLTIAKHWASMASCFLAAPGSKRPQKQTATQEATANSPEEQRHSPVIKQQIQKQYEVPLL